MELIDHINILITKINFTGDGDSGIGGLFNTDGMPGLTVPFEAFPGSIGVLPGLPEVQAWKAREADLAAAGGVVLGPSTGGALPAAVCLRRRRLARSRHETVGARERAGQAAGSPACYLSRLLLGPPYLPLGPKLRGHG